MFNNETFWAYASMWHLNVFWSLCQSANLVGVLTCCMTILSKIRLLGRNTYHTYRTVTYHVTANEQLLQTSGTLSVQVSFPGELGKIGTAANLRIKLKIDGKLDKTPGTRMCGQNCQHSMQSRTVVAQFVSCSFQDHKISGPKWALVCCQIVTFKRMKRTLFQALRKQTAKYLEICKNCHKS